MSAEANKSRIEGLLRGNSRSAENVIAFLPRAVDRYTEMLNNLTETLQRDVACARHQLKQLLGEIALFPSGKYLEAEVSGSYDGLLASGNPKIN